MLEDYGPIPTILLIRHAQASFGSADYDVLSELGRGQVRALVDGLAQRGIRPDRVVSGSLRRQLDTATQCAGASGVSVEVDQRWNEYTDRDILSHHAQVPAGLERRPGDEGLSSRQFQEILNAGLLDWIAAGEDGPADETWPQFSARTRGALADLADALGSGQTALVISSGGVIAALSADLLGVPAQALVAFNHVSINAAITKLAIGRAGTTLISSNEHAHLELGSRSLVSYR